jgi:hypothetical protein
MASSPTRFLDHTRRRATVGRTTLDECLARCRDLNLTTHTTDKHPCPQWDSNPRSQKASGHRPTPQTAWPLRLAAVLIVLTNLTVTLLYSAYYKLDCLHIRLLVAVIKIAKSDDKLCPCVCVHLSVHMEQLCSHLKDFIEILYFSIF